jgi:hypothetical protein
MAIYEIDGEKRNIVGLGKMIIGTKTVSWNIPHLHFLVTNNNGCYEAICLEFGLISVGSTEEESAERLIEHIIYHIDAVMSNGGGFEEFKEMALNDFMNSYWGAYRHIEFCLAETKQDLSNEIESRITIALQELFDKKIRDLISSMAKTAAEEVLEKFDKMSVFKVNSVRYTALKEAA